MSAILLRFRDTQQNDTIEEHNNVIKQHKFVWWGWWKKDSEPGRAEVLGEMSVDIESFFCFLFDRSTDRFFIVRIVDVEFDPDDKIPSPDPEKTPGYYNDARLSAWFKITYIESCSKEAFLKRFESIPTRDYSFFTENDTKDEDENIAIKRVKLRSQYILHLSDIHLGEDYGYSRSQIFGQRTLVDIISDYVKTDLKRSIGLLIVSGDIVSRGNSQLLLEQAIPFLNELCQTLNLEKNKVVITPGNHDIPFHDANFIDYGHETLFKTFLKEFYGEPVDLYGLQFFQFPNGQKLDLLRIHSVRLRRKEESNYGFVDWYLYKNMLSTTKLDGHIKMAVMHHHLVPISAEEKLFDTYQYGSFGVAIDAGRVIDGLQRFGFRFVLNGHKHIPGIAKISRGVRDDNNEIKNFEDYLYVVSAGSAGIKPDGFSEELHNNSFSIYQFTKNAVNIEAKQYNNNAEPRRLFKAKVGL